MTLSEPSVDLVFDPFDPAFKENPYPFYRRLREEAPAFWSEKYNMRVLTRYADVQAAARDWRTFTSSVALDLDESSAAGFQRMDFVAFDPPRHDAIRNMLKHPFLPRAVTSLEPLIRDRTIALLSSIAPGETVDIGERLAHPLPLYVIGHLLGVPEADLAYLSPRLVAWIDRPSPDAMIEESSIRAARETSEYLVSVADRRRLDPGDDLLTVVRRSDVDGEPFSDHDLGSLAFFLFVAGVDSTTSLILNALFWLDRFPEQRRLLAEDPSLMAAAVEEALRYDAPIQHMLRVATRDVELHGTQVPAGTRVMLTYGAANHDDAVFERAEEFDIGRPRRRHFAFGEGIHHCLGADLARSEARIALEEIFARLPNWRVVGPNVRLRKENQRGFRTLTIAT
ncbi:MAG TPA: cytochrome P450 [Propionibacteriaceae bacterium]|nr:cytochrome P450 [Propionibacteriaceae bacterium]